jgi:hypothetical protein
MENNLRAMFAAHAPQEIPEWFEYTSTLTAPQQPKDWQGMPESEDRELLCNWTRDPCCDLPEHLMWYQDEWNDYRKNYHDHERRLKVERYFAWRMYYSAQMEMAMTMNGVKL